MRQINGSKAHFLEYILTRVSLWRFSREVEHNPSFDWPNLNGSLSCQLVGALDRVFIEIGSEGLIKAGINCVDAFVGFFP